MERTIIAAFLDNSHTINENHLISALSSVNNVMATVHKKKSGKAKHTVIAAVIRCLALLVGFLGADKIFNLKTEKPAAQIAVNTYTPQAAENTAPAKEYTENALNNNDIYTDITAETVENNAALVPDNQETANITEQYAANNTNQHTENIQIIQTTPYVPTVSQDVNNIYQAEEQPVIEEPEPVVNRPKDVYILADSLNVRAIPSLESARIASATVGQKYEYVSENENWVQIQISPILTGWVFKQYVSISERP